MNVFLRTVCRTLLPATALLLAAGCGRSIESDLVLAPHGSANIELHQRTDAIDVVNDSSAEVRIRVMDRKGNILSSMPLGAHDNVRLDLQPADKVEFLNRSGTQASLHWVLSNDKAIEYSLAIQPTDY